jgi:hypothetical protein
MGWRSTRPPQTTTMRCGSCGLNVLLRGGDHQGWKGLQKSPNVAEMDWFCPKELCREAFNAALVEAKRAWGVVEVKGEGDVDEEA